MYIKEMVIHTLGKGLCGLEMLQRKEFTGKLVIDLLLTYGLIHGSQGYLFRSSPSLLARSDNDHELQHIKNISDLCKWNYQRN